MRVLLRHAGQKPLNRERIPGITPGPSFDLLISEFIEIIDEAYAK